MNIMFGLIHIILPGLDNSSKPHAGVKHWMSATVMAESWQNVNTYYEPWHC